MFVSLTLESSVFIEKNYLDNWHSIKNTKDLTMKQMFDKFTTLVSEQDEIYGVKTIGWKISSWKSRATSVKRGWHPGLPHSVVKQAENYRVRELVKKIENHPHRQSLQRDLQQNKAYNPFSTTSKKMIQDVGNAELFELFETDPKTQWQRMPIILEWRHRPLHMRASLERNCGQPRRHPIYIGPSLNSKLCHLEGTTSWPQIWENSTTKRISSSP